MTAEAFMYMTMTTIHSLLIGTILIISLILVIGNGNRGIGHVHSKGAAASAKPFRGRWALRNIL